MKKYYYAGLQRIAMRTGSADPVWIFSDHLGSTSKVASSTGTVSHTSLYKAWGETRYTSGTTPTTYRYTGQREEASFGLYYYNARWYDPALGRFAQADTIVPEGMQGLDRYAYVNNNPLKYTDPSGHNPLIIIAIIGFAMMMSQYPGDSAYAYHNSEGNGDVMAWGAALMVAPIIVPASCVDDGCANEVQSISNANQTVNQVGNSVNKYPSNNTTESVFYKLENYLLNPNHPDGGSKAKWFESALGYTKRNLSDLAKQIVFDPKKAIPTEMTSHGQKYVQWIPITGANGKIINVQFHWIKNLDGVVRLITSIPQSNKK